MSVSLTFATTTLIDRLQAGLDAADSQTLTPLLDSFRAGNVHYEYEPWFEIQPDLHGPPERTHGEYLLRARDDKGQPINPEPLVKIINQAGHHTLFDQLIVLTAVDRAIARNELPVSINISSRNASDVNALPALHAILQQHFKGRYEPHQIIFELLEDDVANNPAADTLRFMQKDLGYRFAMDDLSDTPQDLTRLRNLGSEMNVIKIDGKLFDRLRKGSITDEYFQHFLSSVQALAPKAKILCEWLDSPEQSAELSKSFPAISLVQGRALDGNNFSFNQRIRQYHADPKPAC